MIYIEKTAIDSVNQARSHKVIVTYHQKTSRIDFDKIISIYMKKCHIYFSFLFDLIWL